MSSFLITKSKVSFQEKIALASSKSESNRALIIDALTGFNSHLENLSTARDTQTMIRLLHSDNEKADVLDAGTTMRFLTAYFTATGQQKIMTGTERMCQRPIGILVDVLRTLGADIHYLQNDGYPPLKIKGFPARYTSESLMPKVRIKGNVSSQYISALLMIAPTLPKGLEIELIGEVGSIPYITMTIRQMGAFGVMVDTDWENKSLKVQPQKYKPATYKIESDWSGASYWYSIVALSGHKDSRIELLGLKENSLQGDSVIADMMAGLGVKSTFTSTGVLLEKVEPLKNFEWDFSNCPDLAQTIAVVLSGLRIEGGLTGIESLKIKETDRVLALQNELKKLGTELVEVEPNHKYRISHIAQPSETPVIETYDDHRMAMAFAPVSMLRDIIIKDPDVVAKSYPSFWDDLRKVAVVQELNINN